MTLAVRAVFWVIAYLGAVVSPLALAAFDANHPDHGFWTNFSVALGLGANDGRGPRRRWSSWASRPSGCIPSGSTWCDGGAGLRHVQMTRLMWLIAGLIVVACVVFEAAQR
jgi:hypothetical protein